MTPFNKEWLMKELERTKDELIAEKQRELGVTLNSKMKKAVEKFIRNGLRNIPEFERKRNLISAAKDKIRDVIVKTDLGILCLTEFNDNGPMWENYASNYEGFVVGFKTSHAFFDRRLREDEPFRRLMPVEYLEERPARYLSDYAELPPDTFFKDVIYTKNHCYNYENEWRMVIAQASLLNKNGCSGLEAIPVEALAGIFLGPKSGKELEATAKTFTASNDIPLFRMMPGDKLKLEPQPLHII